LQVLAGISYAHQKDVLHRDIKPANIMLTPDGTSRVTDFGIACGLGGGRGHPFGTACYLAPEYIANHAFTPACDVFAIGMVLYEMLAGVPAVSGATASETMFRIGSETYVPPSSLAPDVDQQLDDIVMRALAKDPLQRYASAAAMAEALEVYLNPQSQVPVAETQKGTLEFLLRRMSRKGDFPALSDTIASINRALSSERESTGVLCNSILRDYALTNKLLKLVNAACYGQFGGAISTVSRAIAILGLDGIRSVAVSLMLFENLQNKAQAASIKDELLAAYFSGVLARNLVHKAGIRDAEEAFICAMFHRLGRLLVMFYLPEEAQEIARLTESGDKRTDGAHAVLGVLGMSYEDLGIGVAKKWNFPDRIVKSMRGVGAKVVTSPEFESEKLRVLSDLANELADTVRDCRLDASDASLQRTAEKFSRAISVSRQQLNALIKESAGNLAKELESLGAAPYASPFLAGAGRWSLDPQQGGDIDMQQAALAAIVLQAVAGAADPAPPGNAGGAPHNRSAVLAAGVQDIINTLIGDYQLNDILRIIMETMYRGIGFTRVILCVRDASAKALRGRIGFGQDADGIVQRGFLIPLSETHDVFYAAIVRGADICVDDLDAERIRPHVPDWYRKAVPAHGMVLFPIMINRQPLAMIYADTDRSDVLKFRPDELGLLRTLRNQAVLAFKQKMN
jgi:HD-like signal output (HDOD) protein